MIEHAEVDGVPAVFAHKDGPVVAGLTFRVGQADETLARRGITHLVEHLALHRMGLTDYHSNGATASTLTTFYLEGTEADVVGFLGSVCASLAELPLARLEVERGILRAEEAGRGHPALPSWRYGAQGYGLVGYPEWGVERLRTDEVDAWARAWFTRENAVLWVAGARIPPDLRLALPAGTRRPPPAPTSALDATPAWFAHGDGEVVLDAVVPRSAAASAFGTVLGRELFRTLRQEGGYSYATGANYEPRDDRFATLTAYADAAPDKEDAVLGGLIDVVAAMRAGRIDEAAVSAARARSADRFDEPDVDAQRLASYAGDLLLGGRPETLDELRQQAAAVDVADVHAVAVEAYRTALLKVPEGRTADWAGFAPAPTFSRHAVAGQAYRALEDPDVALLVGPEGVGLRTPDGPVTVRFDQCAARLHWPDGRRVLIGLDGISITVEPTLFALDPQGRAAIDARVDPDLVITRPARDPATIPQPERRAGGSGGPTSTGSRGFLWLCVAITVLMFAIAVSGTADSIQDSSAPDSDWGTTAILWLFVLIPGLPTVRMFRRYRAAARSTDEQ